LGNATRWARAAFALFVANPSFFQLPLYSKNRKRMKAIDINTTLIDGYLRLLDNLSPTSKLDLISKLTLSVKTDITDRKKYFYKAFGAWDSKQTADEIIQDVRNSRILNRQIESF
jgi:hypothetical protein